MLKTFVYEECCWKQCTAVIYGCKQRPELYSPNGSKSVYESEKLQRCFAKALHCSAPFNRFHVCVTDCFSWSRLRACAEIVKVLLKL